MIELFRERVVRARSHAGLFPRPYWVLLSGEAVQSVGHGMIVPFLSIYLTETIEASATEAGALLAIWAVVGLVGQPLGGLLADRIGRRPVIIGGLAVSAIASLAFAFASSIWAVAVLVLVWGAGFAVFEPAAGALVADVSRPDLRTEAYGIWRVVNNAGFTLGPPVAALVIWLSSLRGTFVVAGATVLGFLLIAWRALPETRPVRRHDERPARFGEALRDRLLVVLILGSAMAALVYGIFESALPVFLHDDRGISIATWGLVFGINPLLVTVFQYPISRWAARQSSRFVLALGAALLGASLAFIWPFASMPALVVGIILVTIGEMLVFPVATAVAAELAPERLRGSYQGALNLAFEGAWGPAALGGLWLVGSGHGELLLALSLPLGALGAALFLALPAGRVRREPALAAADAIVP